jgi:hypothetical protein
MFGSNTIDIAIGLGSLFLLLSLMASATNEIIEGFMKKRAKDLAEGIKELAGSDKPEAFLNQFYNHGLINSLFKGQYDPNSDKNLPSYIPSLNFALAVIDIAKGHEKTAAEAPKVLDAQVSPAAETVNAAKATGVTEAKTTDADAKAAVEAVLPHNIRTALNTLKAAAGADVEKYEKNVEDWYNSAMDRVSGWYKRRSQWIIFLIGLGLAIIANADCINYAKRLSTDASLRQSVVAYAEATAKTDPTNDRGKKSPVQKIEDETKDLSGIGLPVGWQGVGWKLDAATIERPFGWLLTALAVSLGAPFWFDMLNKIMVIRSTVKPHEKSKEEKPKDPTQTTSAGTTGAAATTVK